MSTPVRLQLSRKRGFNLQAHSAAVNGLSAVKVDRSTKWGNPFVVHSDCGPSGRRWLMAPEISVATFKSMLLKEGAWWPHPLPWPKGKIPAGEPATVEDVRRELRGKNLACWCKPGAACHADVLLEFANKDTA
jgi:hypothetical protein